MIYLVPNRNSSSGETIDIVDATSSGHRDVMGSVHIDLFYNPRDTELDNIYTLLNSGQEVAVNLSVDNQWAQDRRQEQEELLYG